MLFMFVFVGEWFTDLDFFIASPGYWFLINNTIFCQSLKTHRNQQQNFSGNKYRKRNIEITNEQFMLLKLVSKVQSIQLIKISKVQNCLNLQKMYRQRREKSNNNKQSSPHKSQLLSSKKKILLNCTQPVKQKKSITWSETHFTMLYPESPAVLTSTTFFIVGLHYKGQLLKVKLPTGIQTKHLHYIFHREIYTYLLNIRDSNPLLRTAEIVAFESVDSDLLLDYQISLGIGKITKRTSFNCLEYVQQGRLKKYKIYKCLAIGGFSKVYLVRSLRDGQFYAMKVMLKKFISENQKLSLIQNQKDICMSVNHPFIVKLNHCFQTHNFVCFVMDYCPGGQLFYHLKQIKRMSEDDARFYFLEIMYGLSYLHQSNIVYRDLKPQNLLINHDGHIKIADFGLSKANMDGRKPTYSYCGSTEYMPPEMLLRYIYTEFRQGHSYGVDLYTLGALLYELVVGLPPFYTRDQQQLKRAIIQEQLTFPPQLSLSNEIKSLLSGLLNKNQKLRIGSLKGIKEVMFHPWIGRISSDVVLSKKLTPPFIPSIQQFNFDQNQLGDDEFQFTDALIKQHLIPTARQKLDFQEFDYVSQTPLKPQVKFIYDNYPDKKTLSTMKHSSSLKILKPSNSRPNLRRNSSSPYMNIIQNIGSVRGRQHSPFRNKSVNYKSSCQSLNRSLSKKKKENSNTTLFGRKNFIARNKDNSIKKQVIAYKENGVNESSGFLKKRKYVYKCLQQA